MSEGEKRETAVKGSGGMAAAVWNNGSAQAGIGVSIITLVAQVFARDEVQAVVPVPAIATAMVTALLFAFYQVRFVQRARLAESAILVPLTTIILFAMALGASNTMEAAADHREEAKVNAELLENLQAQVELLKSVSGGREINSELAAMESRGTTEVPRFRSAQAEPVAPPEPPQPELSEEQRQHLEELRAREAELRAKRQHLEQVKKPFWNPW